MKEIKIAVLNTGSIRPSTLIPKALAILNLQSQKLKLMSDGKFNIISSKTGKLKNLTWKIIENFK